MDTDPLTFIHLVLQANKTRIQTVTPHIATLATQLPVEINKDPADRLIVATTLAEGAMLVAADGNLQAAELVPILW